MEEVCNKGTDVVMGRWFDNRVVNITLKLVGFDSQFQEYCDIKRCTTYLWEVLTKWTFFQVFKSSHTSLANKFDYKFGK